MARVELNHDAVAQLLRGEGEFAAVIEDLNVRGERIAEQAGDGVEVEADVGATRARVTVRTGTFEAMAAEANDGSLSSALDAGR